MTGLFFDVKHGHRLMDPAGIDCAGDVATKKEGIIIIVRQTAIDAP